MHEQQLKDSYLKCLHAGSSDPAFVERGQLDMACDDDAEFAAEILEMYRDSMAESLAALHTAVSEGSSDGACAASHSIKGACANLGLVRVVAAAKVIEDAGHQGVVPEQDAVDALQQEVELGGFFLEHFVGHLAAA